MVEKGRLGQKSGAGFYQYKDKKGKGFRDYFEFNEPLERVPGLDYFDAVAAHLVTGVEMPLTLEEELHPLRMMLQMATNDERMTCRSAIRWSRSAILAGIRDCSAPF